jgi:hypothetical protein
MKDAVGRRVQVIWHLGGYADAPRDPSGSVNEIEGLATAIHKLEPKTDEQRVLKARALAYSESLLDARWIIVAGLATSVPYPFLTVLVLWLTVTFTTFGVLAPRSPTIVCVLFVCALSVAGAIFLVLEMDAPFDGLIRISPAPMQYAIEHMNR